MDCEDNLPQYTGGQDLLEWVDPIGIAPSRAGDYRRIAEQLVSLYGITLCDEADAALVGQLAHYYAQLSRMMTRFPNDFDKVGHINILRAYVQHNGLSHRDLPAAFRPLLQGSGASHDAMQQAVYTLSERQIINQIRTLTAAHSRPTDVDTPAVPAERGSTVIRGTGQAFPACRPGEAQAFKSRCDRRAAGHWSQAASSSRGNAARYQRIKCGDREYSLRTDASARARAPLADGLNPTAPGSAKAGYGFSCCILEAKYSSGGSLAFYQSRTRFNRNLTQRAALIKGPGSGVARQVFIRSQQARYAEAAGSATLQLTAYMGAIADPDIPYYRLVYICSNDQARDYFRALIQNMVVARAVARACTSAMRLARENWIN